MNGQEDGDSPSSIDTQKPCQEPEKKKSTRGGTINKNRIGK